MITTVYLVAVAVLILWLTIRIGNLSNRHDELESQLAQLRRRLTEAKEASATFPVKPAPAEVPNVILPPPSTAPVPSVPPLPEERLAPMPIETPPQPEPVALEALPITPAVVEPLAEIPAAPARPITPPPLPAEPFLAALARANAPGEAGVTSPVPPVPPTAETPPKIPPLPAVPVTPPNAPQSFELRLGTYWFVRVGVVILLTGFVFLANLAYRQIVPQLGAVGKVTLLYVGSAALLGAGAWLQRRQAKDSLRNFAHVLLAGGLGAVYFTTYAAHHYEPLRVIGSVVLDGVLLLGWAGFIVWLADRKKSETLALFALGLGFYTAVVTRVGTFTLASNLVLTIATVFFLVRNRWAHLTLAGLVASYGGFAFWRFFHDGQWLLGAPQEHLWLALAFLVGYWLCFTAATFLAEGDTLAAQRRAAFLSANNGAFFALAVLSMASQRQGRLWLFCLSFGGVLMVLAALARARLFKEPAVCAAYVTQGLVLLTVSLILKFTGHQLAVLLAAESVVLLTLGLRQPSRLLRAAAFVAAALAAGWLVRTARPDDSPALGLGVTALLLFNAWWMSRHEDPANTALLRARTSIFALFSLVAGGATLIQHTPALWLPVWFGGAAFLLTASVHWLRTRELTLLGQGYLFLAHSYWLMRDHGWADLPAWRPLLLLAATLAVLHWWTRQMVVGDRKLAVIFESACALGVVTLLYTWVHAHCSAPLWLVAASALALGVTGYGAVTRAWRLAAAGQVFTLVAAVNFVRHVSKSRDDDWLYALAPVGMLLLTAAAVGWAKPFVLSLAAGPRATLPVLMQLYYWSAFAMAVALDFRHVPSEQRPWTLALGGAGLFAFAGWRRLAQPLLASALALGLGLFAVLASSAPNEQLLSMPNLFAVLLPLVLQALARRAPERFPVPANAHIVVVLVAGGFLWLHLSRWLLPQRDGQFFTLAWSLLGPAFIGTGLWLRERTYLVLGLLCLLAGLARVVFHDAWQTELLLLNVVPMLGVFALQRVARRHAEGAALPEGAHTAAIFASGLTLWLFLSRWVVQAAGGKFFLTVSWAGLALVVFAVGFALRERMYRWLGLAVLAGAVGRVVLLDVWQIGLMYRVLAFMALGVVLIVLGYIYNRWQDKIREWL
ncbi:MAG: DUF2339 domain-containing protein [Verrucomicrobia bacterium]|nr:DUF2339 domain-containing protein [Verrucomicrobiota bacterium]